MAEVFVQDTDYVVSAVKPEMTEDWWLFALHVKWQGGSFWAVSRHSQYMADDGTWSWQQRGLEEWEGRHWFGFDEAMTLAKKWAPEIRVNSHVAKVVAAKWKVEQLERETGDA